MNAETAPRVGRVNHSHSGITVFYMTGLVKNITNTPVRPEAVGFGLMNIELNDSTNRFTLRQVCDLLNGEIICSEHLADQSVGSACGCDLMSDVLAFTRPGSVLLTGLTNSQVIRTAEMLDLKAIVFVRSKKPDERTIQMAEALQLVLILSPHPLYESCGRLYTAGLSGCQNVDHAAA